MNERIRSWKCPVCSKKALYNDLIVDSYFVKLLESLPSEDVSEVEIKPDGSWEIPKVETSTPKPKIKGSEPSPEILIILRENNPNDRSRFRR